MRSSAPAAPVIVRQIERSPLQHVREWFARDKALEVLADMLCQAYTTFRAAASGNMRRYDNVRTVPQGIIRRQRLRLRHIDPGTGQSLFVQRFTQGYRIDHAAACDVDEERIGLADGEFFGSDQMIRLLREGNCNDDRVRPAQDILQTAQRVDLIGKRVGIGSAQ